MYFATILPFEEKFLLPNFIQEYLNLLGENSLQK
jgi:hypothetical protein